MPAPVAAVSIRITASDGSMLFEVSPEAMIRIHGGLIHRGIDGPGIDDADR